MGLGCGNCEVHTDNQGFCWTCGKPVDKYWYALYVNPAKADVLMGEPEFDAEWERLIEKWEAEYEGRGHS